MALASFRCIRWGILVEFWHACVWLALHYVHTTALYYTIFFYNALAFILLVVFSYRKLISFRLIENLFSSH